MKTHLFLLLMLAFTIVSCGNDDDTPEPNTTTLSVKTVNELPANPTDGSGSGHYTFFRFSDKTIIPFSDSATTEWDIAFNSTTILVNSGTSGPGTCKGKVVEGIFDELSEAPSSGYKSDNSSLSPPTAIPTGSGNGWYNYNSTTHVISPVPGRILVFKTSDGNYVKMEILNYYKDKPANPTLSDIARYYTFRYAYQPDGSRKF